MQDFLRDLKHSIRMLRGSPGFTFTAIAALALGIAAVTAIFSIVNAVLLRPFPIRDPDRFVILMSNTVDQKGQAGSNPAVSPVKFAFFQSQTGILEDVAASESITFNYTGGDKPERLSALEASAATFQVWGIPIVRGRSFTLEEDSPHGPRVAILSEGFWRTRFAADPRVLGRNIDLNGEAYAIIGVSADNPA
jgi:putative ABC transport system permease protein